MMPLLQDHMEREGEWEHLSHGITSEGLTRKKTSVALRHLMTTTFCFTSLLLQ